MDRRQFLKASGATFAAAIVPVSIPLPESGLTVASLRAAVELLKANEVVSEEWWCVLHPSTGRAVRDMVAREQWKVAYRSWRCAGRPAMPLRDIVAKYFTKQFLTPFEMGVFEGVRVHHG